MGPDVNLPPNYYFGISAATGDLADNHDVISVRTSDPPPLTEGEQDRVKALEASGEKMGTDDGQDKFADALKKKTPFARFHERARRHIGEQRKRTDFNQAK